MATEDIISVRLLEDTNEVYPNSLSGSDGTYLKKKRINEYFLQKVLLDLHQRISKLESVNEQG